MSTVIKLYDSLILNFHDTRDKFEMYEGMAKGLTQSNYKECAQRKRVRHRFDDEVVDNTDPVLSMSASDKFRTQSFYMIIDKLVTEMGKRRVAYSTLHERFNFLLDRSLSTDETVSKAKALIMMYPSDLEEAFTDEFLLFSQMFGGIKSVAEMLRAQIENRLVTSFPNVNIAFRIYLSIFGTSCEGERSFSKLKLIKTYLRSTMGQTRLSSLALLSIEKDLMREMEFDDVINDFANSKSRKVYIL